MLILLLSLGLGMIAIALVAGLSMIIAEKKVMPFFNYFLSFAAATLFGGAVFHLIPDATKTLTTLETAWSLIAGLLVFFLLDLSLQRNHKNSKGLATMIFIGDSLHNLIAGISIGGMVLVNQTLGTTAYIGALLHEIPQEIGDFSIMVHSGLSPWRALAWNTLSASFFLLGNIISWSLSSSLSTELSLLVPFTAGNFLYISLVALMPTLLKIPNKREAFLNLAVFLIGIYLFYLITGHLH